MAVTKLAVYRALPLHMYARRHACMYACMYRAGYDMPKLLGMVLECWAAVVS